MGRRTRREIDNWNEFFEAGRAFVRAVIPRGLNEDQEYAAARRLAERYEIKRFFASGGFGLLLLARDTRTETDVLVKTTLRYDVGIEAKGRDTAGFTRKVWARRQQLQTERRIMVQLRNRGCDAVPNPNDYVFDRNPLLAGPYETDDKKKWRYDDEAIIGSEPYLVMEMIEGRTLEDLMEDRWPGGMDEARALDVMRQVCGVLSLLHQPWTVGGAAWKLVYQDLKPANVMLGPDDRAYLIDMGGCRVTINDRLATEGAHTPGYCAPECTLAQMSITPRADVYAAGATLYHLLTGTNPLTLLPEVVRSLDDHAVRPEKWDWGRLGAKASRPTCELIRACLSPLARDRPADGGELLGAITRLVRA